MYKVYISCPMTVETSVRDKFASILRTMGAAVYYWGRGTPYSDLNVRNADAIVVIPPKNEWSISLDKLPKGTKSEIELANRLCTTIYSAYINSIGEYKIYQTDDIEEDWSLKAIRGSSGHLSQEIFDSISKPQKKTCPVNIKEYPMILEECFDFSPPEGYKYNSSSLSGNFPERDVRLLFLC